MPSAHAFLSPSKHSWINYEEAKLDRVFMAHQASLRGNELHEFASRAIALGVKLPDNDKTINRYVNDAIGYRMTPEQNLFYSPNCYGQADALGFRINRLRVHDLKTGTTPTSMDQLRIYAALFCLEYRFKPSEIEMELRIYQNDDVKIDVPDPMDILIIIQKIIEFDKRITYLREETE
jgi:hypothetical protein